MTTDKNLFSQLEKIGFTKNEATVYIVCLKNIKNTPSSIEKLTKIPRSSIYPIFETLSYNGFIYKRKIGRRVYFFSSNIADAIQNYLNIKKNNFVEWEDNLLKTKKEVEKIQEKNSKKYIGDLEIHEGFGAFSNLLKKVLKNEKNTYWFGSAQIMDQIFSDNKKLLRKKYSFKRMDTSIRDFGISTDFIPQYQLFHQQKDRHILITPEKNPQSFFAVSGDIFGIIKKTDGKIKSYVVEDSEVATLFKEFFKSYWKNKRQ